MRFFDAHCDAVMHIEEGDFDFVAGEGSGHMDLPRLLAAGHSAQVFAIFAAASYYPGRDLCAFAERAIAAIHGWAVASDGRMRVALSRAEAQGLAKRISPAPLLPSSSAPLLAIIGLEGADPLEGRAERLRHFYDLGVRLVIPAWDDNAFSGSSAGPGDGLTAEGFKLIELCQELGVMVDVSHASDAAFEQIRQIVRGPFVASHSNCRALCPAPRNLTDAQIRALADRGGVMGINLAPDFLSPEYLISWDAVMAPVRHADAATRQRLREAAGQQLRAIPRPGVDWIARHVRHAIAIGGEACIGLGGDLDGISFMPAGIDGVEGYPLIPEALAAAGLTESQIEKVCWRNMARVFGEVLG
jgi:membrane dipeptidase